MPNPAEMSPDQFIASFLVKGKRAKMLARGQKVLLALCWTTLLVGVSLKFLGARSIIVMYFGLFGAVCGLGSVIAGRVAQRIYSQLVETGKPLKSSAATYANSLEGDEPVRIPLTIGFANLSGEDLSAIASEDIAALSPLFAQSRVVADHQIPSAEILLVYAHLNEDGTIKGPTTTGIRQIAQLTNAAIIILASPNTSDSIRNATVLPGPKTANIVFTLNRNGDGFGRFFRELFKKMRDGTEMFSAWVELAPQNPNASQPYTPQTVLLAEGGKVAFPH